MSELYGILLLMTLTILNVECHTGKISIFEYVRSNLFVAQNRRFEQKISYCTVYEENKF